MDEELIQTLIINAFEARPKAIVNIPDMLLVLQSLQLTERFTEDAM